MTSPSKRDRADYGFARVRDAAFDAVQTLLRKRKAEGLKQIEIAEVLERNPSWVSRSLSGPGNWTLRTLGELAEALDGEVEIKIHDLNEADEKRSNFDAYEEFLVHKSGQSPIKHGVILPVGSVTAPKLVVSDG